MKMKGLFIVFHGFASSNGIIKKVTAQLKALRSLDVDVAFCNYSVQENGDRCWLLDGKVLHNFGQGIIAKMKKRFSFTPILKYIEQENLSFVYLRSDHNASPFLIYFVKKMRHMGVKVVMEIPTYPYDKEYFFLRDKISLFADRCFRKCLARNLNAIVTFSNDEQIFGQKTICISNGIDFDTISLRNNKTIDREELHLIGVAEIHYWHGFDRLIAGLINYYDNNPKREVYFHIVGKFAEKKEEEKCHRLIREGGLDKFVILHGSMFGEELDALFNQSDFAIGSLARHRSGVTAIKTLKNREYAARGIPFIYSETDDDFESMSYVLKAPANESDININSIIDFVDEVKITPEDIRKSIESLSWQAQMKKVIEQLNTL